MIMVAHSNCKDVCVERCSSGNWYGYLGPEKGMKRDETFRITCSKY